LILLLQKGKPSSISSRKKRQSCLLAAPAL
jgi:hypothetical protein